MDTDELYQALVHEVALVRHVRHCTVCAPDEPKCTQGKALHVETQELIDLALASETRRRQFENDVLRIEAEHEYSGEDN